MPNWKEKDPRIKVAYLASMSTGRFIARLQWLLLQLSSISCRALRSEPKAFMRTDSYGDDETTKRINNRPNRNLMREAGLEFYVDPRELNWPNC